MVDGGWGIYRSTYEVEDHNTWPMELHTDFPLSTPEQDEDDALPKSKLQKILFFFVFVES